VTAPTPGRANSSTPNATDTSPDSFDLGLGGGPVGPGRAFDALARFQFLVDQEEVLDLQPFEVGQVVEVVHLMSMD
jgi:hypothetical protein